MSIDAKTTERLKQEANCTEPSYCVSIPCILSRCLFSLNRACLLHVLLLIIIEFDKHYWCHSWTRYKRRLFKDIPSQDNFFFSPFEMVEPELAEFQVSRTHCSYAQIIFPASFIGQGVSIKMLQWLDGARTPPKYLIICNWWTQNLIICALTFERILIEKSWKTVLLLNLAETGIFEYFNICYFYWITFPRMEEHTL
jgi:hypothetical protein